VSVTHNGIVYNFLRVLKKLTFGSTSKGVSLRFTENVSLRQKLTKTLYFMVVKPCSVSVTHNGHIYKFL
jgi:hypothetical protein